MGYLVCMYRYMLGVFDEPVKTTWKTMHTSVTRVYEVPGIRSPVPLRHAGTAPSYTGIIYDYVRKKSIELLAGTNNLIIVWYHSVRKSKDPFG